MIKITTKSGKTIKLDFSNYDPSIDYSNPKNMEALINGAIELANNQK